MILVSLVDNVIKIAANDDVLMHLDWGLNKSDQMYHGSMVDDPCSMVVWSVYRVFSQIVFISRHWYHNLEKGGVRLSNCTRFPVPKPLLRLHT